MLAKYFLKPEQPQGARPLQIVESLAVKKPEVFMPAPANHGVVAVVAVNSVGSELSRVELNGVAAGLCTRLAERAAVGSAVIANLAGRHGSRRATAETKALANVIGVLSASAGDAAAHRVTGRLCVVDCDVALRQVDLLRSLAPVVFVVDGDGNHERLFAVASSIVVVTATELADPLLRLTINSLAGEYRNAVTSVARLARSNGRTEIDGTPVCEIRRFAGKWSRVREPRSRVGGEGRFDALAGLVMSDCETIANVS